MTPRGALRAPVLQLLNNNNIFNFFLIMVHFLQGFVYSTSRWMKSSSSIWWSFVAINLLFLDISTCSVMASLLLPPFLIQVIYLSGFYRSSELTLPLNIHWRGPKSVTSSLSNTVNMANKPNFINLSQPLKVLPNPFKSKALLFFHMPLPPCWSCFLCLQQDGYNTKAEVIFS